MTALTPEGRRIVSEIAARHGVSVEAAETLLMALVAGQGTQAQFSHPELGGMGQWSQGGMIMVGDMFNNALKAKVDGLCTELSQLLSAQQVLAPRPAAMQSQSQSQSQGGGGMGGTSLFLPGGAGPGRWPEELGVPSSVGAQNELRYAVFPQTRRLAVDIAGRIEVYDTGDHQISGVSQQQSGDQSLTFTSQYGLVKLSELPKVSPGHEAPTPEPEPVAPAPEPPAPVMPEPDAPASVGAAAAVQAPAAEPAKAPAGDAEAVISLIRKLAELHESGILTDAEFEAKKQELLARL